MKTLFSTLFILVVGAAIGFCGATVTLKNSPEARKVLLQESCCKTKCECQKCLCQDCKCQNCVCEDGCKPKAKQNLDPAKECGTPNAHKKKGCCEGNH